jgi:hypothetical protein
MRKFKSMAKNNVDQKQTVNPNDSDNISKKSKSGEPSGTGQNYSGGTSSQAVDQNRSGSMTGQTVSTDAAGKMHSDE